MKTILLILATTIFMSACISKSQKVNEETADLVENRDTGTCDLDTLETDTFMPIDLAEYRDTIVGNFSGHGIDTLISEPIDTVGDRMCWKWQIKDTKSLLKTLILQSHWDARMVYEGDLDRNGTDEFGIRRQAEAGTWDNYNIFTYDNGEWKYLTEPIWTYSTHFYKDLNMGKDAAERTNKKGKIRIRHSGIRNGGDICIIDTLWSVKISQLKEYHYNDTTVKGAVIRTIISGDTLINDECK